MKINREFTSDNQSPYQDIKFKKVSTEIRNPDGSIVFELKDFEVPEQWSQVASDILSQKYFRKAGVPNKLRRTEERNVPSWLSPRIADEESGELNYSSEKNSQQVFDRLAGAWTYWGWKGGYFSSEEDAKAFFDEVRYMLANQMIAPNSPQWFNTGLNWAYGIDGPSQGHFYVDHENGKLTRSSSSYERPQPHACFIQSIDDDLVNDGGIMDLWVREARLFKYGSGTGTNFSNLRGATESLAGGGNSSGLMSFLRIGDRAAGAIKSGGTTRIAAKMVICDMDHPDIEEFINWKVVEEQKVASIVAGSKLHEKQLNLIWETCEEPVLFFDGDKAGLKATERVVELALPFLAHNRTLRIARPLENFDPDDMLRAEGRDSVIELVTNSISIIDFIFDREKAAKNIDSPERIRKMELNLKRKAISIKDVEVRRLFLSKIGEKLREFNTSYKFKKTPQFKSDKHFYSGLKAKKSNSFRESERELEKIEAEIIYCLVNNPSLLSENRVKLNEIDFQDPSLRKLFWEITEKLEENIAPDIKEKLKKKTLQKDPSLKSHLIYNNDKEAEKSKKLLLNAISLHNLALNRLERLKDLKIKLKNDAGESKDESESLEKAQIKYHLAISGEKYIKESIAKEKEAYKETLDQLSNKVRRKTSEK